MDGTEVEKDGTDTGILHATLHGEIGGHLLHRVYQDGDSLQISLSFVLLEIGGLKSTEVTVRVVVVKFAPPEG